jgi:hypothetical protein
VHHFIQIVDTLLSHGLGMYISLFGNGGLAHLLCHCPRRLLCLLCLPKLGDFQCSRELLLVQVNRCPRHLRCNSRVLCTQICHKFSLLPLELPLLRIELRKV